MRRALLWAFVYFAPVLFVVQRPVLDPDIWWHLRTGQWIVEHGAVPTTDSFSQYGMGKPWMAYSWLFELIVYGLHQQFGLLGIVAFRVAGALAVAAALQRLVARREPRLLPALGWTFLGLVALLPILQERSWIFSVVFYALTLDVVLDVRAGRPNRLTWWLPVLYAIWANVHIQFLNGLFLLGLTFGAEVLERVLRRVPPHAQAAWRQTLQRLALLFLACPAATLVNPYTWRLYLTILELPTQSGAYLWLTELRALGFRWLTDWVVLGLTCLAAYALGARPRVGVLEVLMLASGALFAFRAQRDVWLVVLPALAILAGDPRQVERPCVPTWQRAPGAVLGLALVLVLVLVTVRQSGITEDWLREELAKNYPAVAVEKLAESGPPGPLYNHYDWGGFLIWRLPGLPVSMDGRSYLHGDERMERAFHTIDGRRGWRDDPELAAAGVVLLKADLPLVSLLRQDGRFRLVYEDKVAVVFVARER